MSGSRREQLLELMGGQLGVWYAQQLGADNSAFNMGEYLEIRGDLDVPIFTTALSQAVNEANGFYLRFCTDNGAPRQYVDESADWQLHYFDLSSAGGPHAALEWMEADMRTARDLESGLLFTQALFRV